MLKFTLLVNRELEIKDLYLALVNYILSKQKEEELIIRVNDINLDDTKYEQISLDILKKFSIDTTHLYYQSKNLKIYQQFAQRLFQEQKAYLCFCQNKRDCNCLNLTQEDIQTYVQNNKKYSIYLKAPKDKIEFVDILKNRVTFNPNEIGDIKILDFDKNPTYNFAEAIDNMNQFITTVVNEETKLINSVKQAYILKLLNYNYNINYIHLPQLLNGNITILELFKDGFLPDAIINYLFKFSFNKEVFYLPELIEKFDIFKIEQICFDKEELKRLNQKHLKSMDSKKLSSIFGFADSDIGEFLKLFLDEVYTFNQLEPIFKSTFSKKVCNSEAKELSDIILKSPMIDNYDEFVEYLIKNSNFSKDKVVKYLKFLLIGNLEYNIEVSKLYKYLKSYILEVARCQ